MSSLAENLRDLPELLSWHLLLSLCALTTAATLTLILAIAADRSEKIKRIALDLAGTVQTIPSLALLAMMVPLLGGAIGFAPAYAALTLYGVLPMLQNTITGLDSIDGSLIEAARGLGMSERQILRRVRFLARFSGHHRRPAHGHDLGGRPDHAGDGGRRQRTGNVHFHRPADAQ